MSNDPSLEQITEKLGRLRCRPAPPAVRAEILQAIRGELGGRGSGSWIQYASVACAASLLLAIGLHTWVIWADDARQTRIAGPQPLPRGIVRLADDVRGLTRPGNAQLVQRRLILAGGSQPGRRLQQRRWRVLGEAL